MSDKREQVQSSLDAAGENLSYLIVTFLALCLGIGIVALFALAGMSAVGVVP